MNKTLYTVGQIADRLEQPPARIAYVISKYRFKPIQRVGIIRLFDDEQIRSIAKGLSELQARTGKDEL